MLSIATVYIARVVELDAAQPNNYSLALLLVALLAGVVLVLTWARRQAPGAALMAWMMAALVVWAGGYSLELSSADAATMLFWVRVEYLGGCDAAGVVAPLRAPLYAE